MNNTKLDYDIVPALMMKEVRIIIQMEIFLSRTFFILLSRLLTFYPIVFLSLVIFL